MKIIEDVGKYAAEQAISKSAVLEKGLKSAEFVKKGAQVCAKA